ncbi:MAG TPA: YicC/YloC family endoribonuclease, partial [Gammaproteobacteria bacterium]|nr:YicC/YloC family endoribonuclease [Gammaproteobacteria bacterium]
MIRSMTAFARRESQGEWGKLTWELRSVNHRYLDIHPRLPDELRFLETGLRERVGARLARGKVECNLRYRPAAGAAGTVRVNWAYADQIVDACDALARRLKSAAPVSPLELLGTPGVTEEADPDLTPVAAAAMTALDDALGELVEAREREGARLAEVIRDRAGSIGELTGRVRERRVEVNRGVRDRL